MNYQNIYNNLIEKRKLNPVTEGYKEKHHILPKSLGGTNDKSNLVALTGREHWVAHLLLHKIHKRSETAYACHIMAMNSEERDIVSIKSSRTYERIRIECSKLRSVWMKKRSREGNHPCINKKWVHNPVTKKSKLIHKKEDIPDGWSQGSLPTTTKDDALYWYNLYIEGDYTSIRDFVKNSNYKYSHVSCIKLWKRYIPNFKPKQGKKYKINK